MLIKAEMNCCGIRELADLRYMRGPEEAMKRFWEEHPTRTISLLPESPSTPKRQVPLRNFLSPPKGQIRSCIRRLHPGAQAG